MGEILELINNILWSMPLVILVLGAGVYFSMRMRFPQIRCLKEMIRLTGSSGASEKGMSSIQSFIFTAARSVGVGNIAGMATGIYFGGPGAIFWLWVLAFFGTSIAQTEATLAQTFKRVVDGEYRGGPAYYMEGGMKNKKTGKIFATAFAVITVVSVTFLMPCVQSFNIVHGVQDALGGNIMIYSILFTAVLALTIIGGLKRIGNVAQRLSPIMGCAYVIMALIIIIFNIGQLPSVLSLIVKSALSTDAMFGAIAGSAISWGIKRGVYANEVGIGTSAITSASAEVSHPAKQGLVAGLSVYIGTIFVCTTSAIMMLMTGCYNVQGENGGLIYEGLPGKTYGNKFVSEAINTVFPGFGEIFVAMSILCFAFVALTAYYLYTESNVKYLFGSNRKAVRIVQIFFIISVFVGTILSAQTIWTMGDIGNALMAWLNVVALIILGNQSVKIFKDYDRQKKENIEEPVFDPEKLGILNVGETWNDSFHG